MNSDQVINKPNVLLISVDDMNDWVGCLSGYPGISTPNIDALANRGVLFRNAHCSSPLCNPSRTAILTGMQPHRSGIYSNAHWWRPNFPHVMSLPMHFKANGYQTAGAGKVYHHTDGFNPPDQWDEYFDQIFDDPWDRKDRTAFHRVKVQPAPDWHPMNGLSPFTHEHDWGPHAIPEADYGDMQAVSWAQGFLSRKHEKPFFLAVGTSKPHLPWYAPPRFFNRYPKKAIRIPSVFDSDLDDLPLVGQELAAFSRDRFERIVAGGQWEQAIQAYLACISFADEMIGRLIGALDASPYAKNTVIVFYSDNGYHLGEKKHFTKCTLWERSTHVPFIIVPPVNKVAAYRHWQTDAPVSLQDIYPTLIDFCGLPMPAHTIDGKSLKPNIDDPFRPLGRAVITTYLPGNHAVRLEHWRYIRYRDGGEELYNTFEDPDERYNLASDPAYAHLKSDFTEFIPRDNAPKVLGKEAFIFDAAAYKWELKQTPRR